MPCAETMAAARAIQSSAASFAGACCWGANEMSLEVNNVFVTVDEDLVAVNDPDETTVFAATYNASLTSAFAAITGAAPTADFTTRQIAAQDNCFTLGANPTDLKLCQNAQGDEYPVGGTNGVDSGLKTADGTSIYLF